MNTKSEAELRAEKVPTFSNVEELTAYINSLVDREHDYGTCVYAMSMSAVAAFNYAASALGVTGFQASCADLDIIRRTRNISGPFMLVDLEKAVYPQYNLVQDVTEFITENQDWLAARAMERLAEDPATPTHPDVKSHWLMLAAHKKDENPPPNSRP